MIAGLYHDGHKPWRPLQWRPQTITAPKKVHDGHTEDYDVAVIVVPHDCEASIYTAVFY